MAITLGIWEDSGPVISNRGTDRDEVANLGYKDSSLPELYPFVDYPIGRPYGSDLFAVSYKKYYFFKITGTYDTISEYTVNFDGNPEGNAGTEIAGNLRILYKWSHVYEQPTKNLLNGTFYHPSNPPIWTPMLSSVGPEDATTYPTIIPDTTYYTQYLITQLYVDLSTDDDFGNLQPSFKLKMNLKERKGGLPNYDPDLVNWSP